MELFPIRPIRGLLFDLDGTLVDSIPDIARSANAMLDTLGLPTVDITTLVTWVGNGAGTLVKRALTGEIDEQPAEELFREALPIFFDHYANNVFVRSRIYPEVINTLEQLQKQNYPMACVTNKPGRHTQALLQQSGLNVFFDCVVASDTTTQVKPHPLPLLHACHQMNLPPEDCVMVGDSINDIKAAKAALMPVVCLTYGYNQGIDLTQHDPDLILNRFSHLLNFVCKSA
ncbi:MAG: phosphoglycolate phosphatase [Gammaproteobacteria bacterium]|nr:phosphoglycolate phosphatase [Gammaproteobacteria bacterium]